MRLINAHTLRLEEFTDETTPPYAILSHTWTAEEITFQMLRDNVPTDEAKWEKIIQSCRLTREHQLQYVWIDTCCIDKSSSAELTESINSMFHWYAEAKSCFAYLSDLADESDIRNGLKACRWCYRGWTLQELIAPQIVLFFNAAWKFCGARSEFAGHISDVLDLPVDILKQRKRLETFSVAQRMSWASSRRTTRLEDAAYCLLGIFNISMPLIYGEGSKAFQRLQEAIIAQTSDLTVLAWRTARPNAISTVPLQSLPLLAPDTVMFKGNSTTAKELGVFLTFTSTNQGLLIRGDVKIRTVEFRNGPATYALRIGWETASADGDVKIALRRIGPSIFCRDHTLNLNSAVGVMPGKPALLHLEECYILHAPLTASSVQSLFEPYRSKTLHIPRSEKWRLIEANPLDLWDCHDRVFLKRRGYTTRVPEVISVLVEYSILAPDGTKSTFTLGILCDYNEGEPILYVLDAEQFLELMPRSNRSTLHWYQFRRLNPGFQSSSQEAMLETDTAVFRAELVQEKIRAGIDHNGDYLVFALHLSHTAVSRTVPGT